jgi:hypothetical protein
MLDIFKRKPTTPQELAELAQRILDGRDRGLDVDGYENVDPKDATLKDLHTRTLRFGLPEKWVKLDDASKNKLRAIIEEMKQLESKRP